MIGAFLGAAAEPARVEDHQQHGAGHRQHQAAEQIAPMHRARAEIVDVRPLRPDQPTGADLPDHVRQRQHGDHEQRIERIERHQRAPAARGGERKSRDQEQQHGRRRRGEQQQAGLDRPGEPGIAAILADDLPGVQQQQRPDRTRQHQRTEFDAGRPEGADRHGQQHRQHRLLTADDGAREQIQRPERRDVANLRQQIDAEHVIADGAEGDVGKPERQRRTEIGTDLEFPAEGQHGSHVAGRAAIQHQRQDQPHRRLKQQHDPDHQPRPGADQFDDQGGETHETPEIPQPARLLAALCPKRLIERASARGNCRQMAIEISDAAEVSTVKRSRSACSGKCLARAATTGAKRLR